MNLSRKQINDFANGLRYISSQARQEFANDVFEVWSATHDMDALQDAIDAIAPAIADKYGAVASQIAADMWEEIYLADTGMYSEAIIPDLSESARHELYVDSLWAKEHSDEGNGYIKKTGRSLERVVKGYARNTTLENTLAAARHGELLWNGKPRWARVPVGKTCAFCQMLASRGFIYSTAESAGEFNQFHDDCDCMIVPAFSEYAPNVVGYDPDELYSQYQTARGEADSGNTSEILSQLRKDQNIK